MVSRSGRLAVLAAVSWFAAPAAAQAGVPLAAAATTARICQAGFAPAAPGVASVPFRATSAEVLSARTAGTGDWDLAVYDRVSGAKLGGAASTGAGELVSVLLRPGQVVDVQACRRAGAGRTLDLTLRRDAVPPRLLRDAEPPRLLTVRVGSARDVRRLQALGLDVTHNAHGGKVDVVGYGPGDRTKLRRAGFRFTTAVADLAAADRADRRADRRAAAPSAARALPSARTTYRAYEDFGTDMKALAAAHPGHVRVVQLPLKTLEGRAIEGVELGSGIGRAGDGRPTFLLGGGTHAREWPGAELALEYAIDLARSYGRDERVTALLERVRVVVVPVLNPDGYVVSRSSGPAEGDDRESAAVLAEALTDAAAYKRKNCRAQTPELQATPCILHTPFGVDLNRAYSPYWGGEGTSDNPTTQQYRGTAPFSEPEAQALREWAKGRQVQTFISNHTHYETGLVLRQPGFKIEGDEVGDVTPDEAGMKALGDAIADATGYRSEVGYATLGNITGPSDDFLYYAQGTYGFTPEMRGDNFHTGYADAVIGEYEGEGPQAGRGWREAYLLATEQTADPAHHSVLTGRAPAGATLRLTKTTTLRTSPLDFDGDGDTEALEVPESFDTSLVVPASGRYEWHVNPSTRPLAPAPEAWTLSCEGAAPRQVVVARGESRTVDLDDCVVPSGTATAPPAASPPVAAPAPSGGRPLRLAIHRPPFSARRANRTRTLNVRLGLRDATLRAVRVVVTRRGVTVARGSVATLRAGRTVALRRVARVRPGTHQVTVTAAGGVRLTKAVRVAP